MKPIAATTAEYDKTKDCKKKCLDFFIFEILNKKSHPKNLEWLYKFFSFYSEIASSGHSGIQTPQSTHKSSSHTAFSSSIDKASVGQTSTHILQPVHFSLSIVTAILILRLIIAYFVAKLLMYIDCQVIRGKFQKIT